MKLSPLWLIPPALFSPAVAHAVQYLTVEQAQKVIFPEASRFDHVELNLSQSELAKIEELAEFPLDKARLEVWHAYSQSGPIGYMFVNEVIGKHEYITYAVGVALDGSVTGVEILDYRETQGDQVRDYNWRRQFNGKTVSDELSVGEDVKNISGATYSCRHVTQGIKRLTAIYRVKFQS